jgi:hypothetical protein
VINVEIVTFLLLWITLFSWQLAITFILKQENNKTDDLKDELGSRI